MRKREKAMEKQVVTTTELKRIPIKNIVQNSTVPEAWTYNTEKMEWLKRSHEESGQITYPEARKEGGVYSLRHGHHRVETARRLGWTHYIIAVGDFTDDQMREGHKNENDESGGAGEDHYVRVWKSYEADMERLGVLEGLTETKRRTAIARAAGMWDESGGGLSAPGLGVTRLLALKISTESVTGMGTEAAADITATAKKAFAAIDKDAKAGITTPAEAKKAEAAVRKVVKKSMKDVSAKKKKVAEAQADIRAAVESVRPKKKQRGRPIIWSKLATACISLFDKSKGKESEAIKKILEQSKFADHASQANEIKRVSLALSLRIKRDQAYIVALDNAVQSVLGKTDVDEWKKNKNNVVPLTRAER